MARIISTIDTKLELTIHTVSGPVTGDELIAAAVDYVRDSPSRLALWDFTGADFSPMPTVDLVPLFDAAKPFIENRRGGKSAFLFNSREGFGLGRMSEMLADSRDYPYEVQAFWDREAAMNWLTAGVLNAGEGTVNLS
jgi:hypothetical protein